MFKEISLFFPQITLDQVPFHRCQCCKFNKFLVPRCARIREQIPCGEAQFQATCSDLNSQDRVVKAIAYYWLTALRDDPTGESQGSKIGFEFSWLSCS